MFNNNCYFLLSALPAENFCIHYRQPTNIVMRSISPTSPSTKPGVAYSQYQQKKKKNSDYITCPETLIWLEMVNPIRNIVLLKSLSQ